MEARPVVFVISGEIGIFLEYEGLQHASIYLFLPVLV